MTEAATPSVPCGVCGATVKWKKPPKSPDRIPQGWKRRAGEVFCGKCWAARFILRAVTIAVAAPETGTWDELRAALRLMWAQTTQASNWIMSELYSRDAKRGSEDKMPPMKPVYLYPALRVLFPGLPSQSCAALEKSVTAKYRAKRYEIVWTCAASLPTHRYPTPFPVPNQGWSVEMQSDHPVVSLRVGDTRLQVRLRAGARYRRQLAAVRQIVSGEAEQGQMDIYTQGKDVMCKMVAWIPRSAAMEHGSNILFVHSSAESLAVAVNAKDEQIWIYNADHIRRWSAEHRKQLLRWAEDVKFEHRPVPPLADRRRAASLKYHQRMAAACHQISALIVGYATRRKFAGVQYDDRLRDFCPDFVWHSLALQIAQKCDAAGLEFERIGEQLAAPTE